MIGRLVVIAIVALHAPAAAETSCKSAAEQARCATACDAKQYDTCARLGLALINSGDTKLLARAVALLEKACTGKAALGCGGLGSLYMGGIGVLRDPPRAVKLFESACTGGDALSCESLGGWIAQGEGDRTKLGVAAMTRAAPYYERACTMGRPAACAFLGTFMLEGATWPGADPKRIPVLFDTACRGDVNVACKFLGDLYADGKHVRRDAKKANELYAKACKLGYDRGCQARAN
jgi:uncharacterized protein